MIKCNYCNKSLRAIGHARKGGADHKDWKERTLHKQCWIHLKDSKHFLEHEISFGDLDGNTLEKYKSKLLDIIKCLFP
tara:strand:+ start:6918 stop:7151 length:234 start_codon:yes stop_codon:yes gene_type:complete